MSVSVVEKFDSRRLTVGRDGRNSSLQLEFIVSGTTSETTARIAVENASPMVYGSVAFPPLLYRQSVSLAPMTHDAWTAVVSYDSTTPEPLSANDSFEFTTTGGTQRITQSIATVARVAASGTAPDFKGAIGVTDNGVEGVDVTVPVLQFSETHFYAEVSPSYKALVMEMTGRVNELGFRGLEAGEVLFLGVDGRREDNRRLTPWVLTYKFAVSKNRSNFYVGDLLVPSKLGWDYMWVRYERFEDATTNSILTRPSSVNIEQVYQTADFGALGLD